jgi:hypothetical protein
MILAALWWAFATAPSPPVNARGAARIDAVAGFTKIAATEHYIMVVNVLPAEDMFTQDQMAQQHPTHGKKCCEVQPVRYSLRAVTSRHTNG